MSAGHKACDMSTAGVKEERQLHGVDLDRLYETRFSPAERLDKVRLWTVLVRDFFQRYIDPTDHVLDIGGGFCEFINMVQAARKYVVDSNPAVESYAAADVQIMPMANGQILGLPEASCDVAFASNIFEHLHDTDELFRMLREIRRILKPGGRLLVLQPNIKYAYREYWDFIDHHLPLSHESVSEALISLGFRVQECYPRSLPYSTKSRLPKLPSFVQWYLRLPILWPLFGKQMFLVAARPS